MKLAAAIVSIVLYFLSYQICEYFYATNIELWWDLRMKLYAVQFFILFAVLSKTTSGITRLMINFGLGISANDLIDRVFFDVTFFQWNDLLMLTLTALTSLYEWKYRSN